jgi:hypothetical protein
MKSTAPLPIELLFIRTASASSQCPFLLKEKEQAEVRQSLTFRPYTPVTGVLSILQECSIGLQDHEIAKKEPPMEFQQLKPTEAWKN